MTMMGGKEWLRETDKIDHSPLIIKDEPGRGRCHTTKAV